MAALIQDLRYGLRGMAASPRFTAIVLLTMGLGTGANATVFSVMSAMLFRAPPGVSEPARLASVYTRERRDTRQTTALGHASYADYQMLAAKTDVFEGVAASRDDEKVVLAAETATENVRRAMVSANFFDVLGVQLAIGRAIATAPARDDHANGNGAANSNGAASSDGNAAPAAIIGFALWQRAFGGRGDIVGQRIWIDDKPFVIVGVAPARFRGLHLGRPCEVWTPLPNAIAQGEGDTRVLSIVGRLKTGVDLSAAQRAIASQALRQADATAAAPSPSSGATNNTAVTAAATATTTTAATTTAPTATATSSSSSSSSAAALVTLPYSRLDPAFRGEVLLIGGVVLGATGLVLIIACANVSSLLLARATARRREMAVRFAMGASRGRLIQQLITESLILAVAGSALGLLCAYWTSTAVPALFSPEQAEMLDTRIDARVWLFTTVLALISGVSFGLAPAAQATRQLQVAALRGDASGISDAHGAARVRAFLVIAQVALSCVLVVATAVLVRSLQYALRGDLGGAAQRTVVIPASLPGGHDDPRRGLRFLRTANDRVRRLAGVQAAAWVTTLPLGATSRARFDVVHVDTSRVDADVEVDTNVVTPEYFSTMEVKVTAGRTFDGRDSARATPVVIVDEELARRYFGGAALGHALIDRRGDCLEIVGVVRSGKYRTLQEAPRPMVYYPLLQRYSPDLTLVARGAENPRDRDAPIAPESIEAIAEALRVVDGAVVVRRTSTLDAYLAEALASDKMTIVLVGACGALAVGLAMIGVYGVMTDAVVRRTREFGVRLALGARPLQVVRLIFVEGLTLTIAGVLLGLVGAVAAARLLAAVLHGVGALDLPTLAMTPALLLVMALVAALVPARRALRVDPIKVLREP